MTKLTPQQQAIYDAFVAKLPATPPALLALAQQSFIDRLMDEKKKKKEGKK